MGETRDLDYADGELLDHLKDGGEVKRGTIDQSMREQLRRETRAKRRC